MLGGILGTRCGVRQVEFNRPGGGNSRSTDFDEPRLTGVIAKDCDHGGAPTCAATGLLVFFPPGRTIHFGR